MAENDFFDLLASPAPKKGSTSSVSPSKNKLSKGSFSLDNICKRMAESERRIVDLSAINQRVIKQLEAEEAPDELEDIKKLLLLDPLSDCGLNKFDTTQEVQAKHFSIFTCQPNTVFTLSRLYRQARIKIGEFTKLIDKQTNDVAKAKIALRIISLDNDEQRLGNGKAYLVTKNIRIALNVAFPTLLKILINYGVDGSLLSTHIYHFSNIESMCTLKTRKKKNETSYSSASLADLYTTLPQVLECLHLLLDEEYLQDSTLIHDYISIVCLLFIDFAWSHNRTCMRTLKQFLIDILQHIPRSIQSLETCTQAVLKFLPAHSIRVVALLSFLPNETQFSRRLKRQICVEALETFDLQIDSSVSGLCLVLEQLHSFKIEDKDLNIALLFIKEMIEDMELTPEEEKCLGLSFRKLSENLIVDRERPTTIKVFRSCLQMAQMFGCGPPKSEIDNSTDPSPPKKQKTAASNEKKSAVATPKKATKSAKTKSKK